MDAHELAAALALSDPSMRHRAALYAGIEHKLEFVEVLVARCEVEPDLFVRDMLTWALIQNDHSAVVAALIPQLDSVFPQARAQALHTLSKLNDPSLWQLVTHAHLLDEEDDVARTAWRAAARMVPDNEAATLADLLGTQFGRGDRSVQSSLSKALVALAPASTPVIEAGTRSDDPSIRSHAHATKRLLAKPEEGYELAVEYAQQVLAQLGTPTPPVIGGDTEQTFDSL